MNEHCSFCEAWKYDNPSNVVHVWEVTQETIYSIFHLAIDFRASENLWHLSSAFFKNKVIGLVRCVLRPCQVYQLFITMFIHSKAGSPEFFHHRKGGIPKSSQYDGQVTGEMGTGHAVEDHRESHGQSLWESNERLTMYDG